VTAVGSPANGSAVTNGDTVTHTPNANFNGTDTFTCTIGDGNGGFASASVTVTVTGVNDPRSRTGGPYNVIAGGTVQLDASGSTDPDLPYGDTLTYAWDFNKDGNFTDAIGVPHLRCGGLIDGAVVDRGQVTIRRTQHQRDGHRSLPPRRSRMTTTAT
jgi:hypothetical protein